jgi:4-oxalocrotonate tautomerase
MPFISIKTTGRPLAAPDIQALQQETTRLMAEVMGKQPEVTAVLVEPAPAAAWSVGGRSLAETGGVTAHVDIKITQGTNMPEQKAAMLAETRRMLERVLPGLHPVCYVVIDEVPATDWGYGGISQEARKRAAA